MQRIFSVFLVSSVLLLGTVTRAQAQITDAIGDFLPTYAGPQVGDVDVISAHVVYTGSSFILSATMNGAIGTTSGAAYIWGFDRGAGTARFAGIGATNIFFDSVVTLRPDTTATVNRIVGGGSTTLPAGTVAIVGNRFTATIAASELPTQGLALGSYTWNLWPRVGTGNNNQISDFAPNNANAAVVSAPEPGSLALILLGSLALVRRRRKTLAS